MASFKGYLKTIWSRCKREIMGIQASANNAGVVKEAQDRPGWETL